MKRMFWAASGRCTGVHVNYCNVLQFFKKDVQKKKSVCLQGLGAKKENVTLANLFGLETQICSNSL